MSDAEKLAYTQQLEAWLEKYKAQLEVVAANAKLTNDRQDKDRDTEAALLKAVHDGYVAAAQASVDRSLTRVNVLMAAISAVTGIYTGVLGIAFGAQGDHTLKPEALVPAAFLGIALLGVAIYAAGLKSKSVTLPLLPRNRNGTQVDARLVKFIQWCNGAISARLWALWGSIASFAVAVAALPLPFIAGPQPGWYLGVGFLLIVAAGLAGHFSNKE